MADRSPKRPSKRALAAKKAWATRRKLAKARSAAAKRGWATRKAKAAVTTAQPAKPTYVPLTPREAKERVEQLRLAKEEQARIRHVKDAHERLKTYVPSESSDGDYIDRGDVDYGEHDDGPDYGSDDVDTSSLHDSESDFDLDYNDDFFEELEAEFEEFEFEKLS